MLIVVSGWWLVFNYQSRFSVCAAGMCVTVSSKQLAVSGEHCKLYPDLAAAMLRQRQTAAGRLWLLLRHLDGAGRGWLYIADLKPKLCQKKKEVYFCGWRQLRNLLQQGKGVFWTRDKERVWLFSQVKVAANLGVNHFRQRPTALPVSILYQGVGAVRAFFYAGILSNEKRAGGQGSEGTGEPLRQAQDKQGSNGEFTPSPPHLVKISRATLTDMSGVSRRTQHSYERNAGIQVHHHYKIEEQVTKPANHDFASQHGQAAFTFVDYHGHHGEKGQRYLARQLANSYQTSLARLGKCRQNQLNQQLTDLRIKRDAGNGQIGDWEIITTETQRNGEKENTEAKNLCASASLW